MTFQRDVKEEVGLKKGQTKKVIYKERNKTELARRQLPAHKETYTNRPDASRQQKNNKYSL